MSWKIEVVVDDSGEWEGDPLRFETQREALAYARDLEFRWSVVRDKRIVKSQDPVNHSWPQCSHGGSRPRPHAADISAAACSFSEQSRRW